MSLQESFNRSALSRFLNSPSGRVFRLAGGSTWLALGIRYRRSALGWFSMLWGVLAMFAGAFDVCFFSLVLGGPFSGDEIRGRYQADQP